MSTFVPSRLGCAAVSWFDGFQSLSIRVFYVSTNSELVMLSWDDKNYQQPNPPQVQWTIEQITYLGNTINGIPQAKGDAITAVSVHPNTPQHEIHLFYVAATSSAPRLLQSLVLNVATGNWFADENIGQLNTGDCPSAAIGWETGEKNSFRLYFGRETDREKHSDASWSSFNEILELAYDGDGSGGWYAGNGGQRISRIVTEAMRQRGNDYSTRVSACTWLDDDGKRQIRVYHGNEARNMTELIYSDAKWQKGGDHEDFFYGSRGYGSATVALINNGQFEGIRNYAVRPQEGSLAGQTDAPVVFNELAYDQSSHRWTYKLITGWLPGLQSELFSDGEQEKIQFAATAWKGKRDDAGTFTSTSIRLYRVAVRDGASNPSIEETTFDATEGQAGKWIVGSKYIN